MNKEKILKKSQEYTNIIQKGKNIKNKYFKIFYLPNNTTLYGITIPKKVGNAVIRNKLKRQIKNIIMENELYIQKNYNYVIIIKETALDLTYQELSSELINTFKKVGKYEK